MELSNHKYISPKGEEVLTLMPMNSFKSVTEKEIYIAECEKANDEYWASYPREE